MATIYKEINSTTPVVLDASVFADGIEIHPDHRLRNCTSWQWYFDDLTGTGPTAIMDATSETYSVPLTSVDHSGEYFCRITIGNTGECDQESEHHTVSIVDCRGDDAVGIPYAHRGGTGSVNVGHAHFETATFSNEGLDWITETTSPIQCAVAPGECVSIAEFSVAGNTGSEARRGQVSMTVGDIVCYKNVVSNYQAAVVPAEEPDPAPGPFINLSQDGPAFVNTNVAVTAEVGTVGGTGSETYTVAWTNATVDPQNDRRAIVNSATAGTTIVTATVTSSTGGTATSTINVVHNAVLAFGTTVTGTLAGGIQNRGLFGNAPQLTDSGTITVTGGGNWFVRMTLNPTGFFTGPVVNSGIRVTVTGPGVNFDETITSASTFINREFQMENLTGTYNWTLEWNPRPSNSQSWAQGSVGLFARLF